MQFVAARIKPLVLRTAPVLLAFTGLLAASASAAGINWTPISEILEGLGTVFLPSLLTLVMNALPIIITLTIIGFIISFLDKIVQMIKMP